MNTTTDQSIRPAFDKEAYAWRLIVSALCGAIPPEDSAALASENYELREEMKTHATAMRTLLKGRHGSFRAPYLLMHAYSHYCRAFSAVERLWPSHVTDAVFPGDGLHFKDYLSAWLVSVAVPQLKATAEELDAVEEATGVVGKKHPLLPIGRSEFDRPVV